MTQNDQSPFLLDDILVSPQHNTLTLQGRTLSVQPKVMAVLCYLAHHRDRVVSNDELLDHVWQGRVVTHASVQKSMNTLRNALAELAGAREFVAHFSKRGYQLTVPVSFAVEAAAPEHPPASAQGAPKPERRRRTAVWIGLPLSLCLLAVLVWLAREQSGTDIQSPQISPSPTSFVATHPVSIEGRRDRHAEPHPDGKRIAFVRDLVEEGEPQSQILLREGESAEWLLASVDGVWADLAWSPSGRNLVATEIQRAEGLPWNPDYFEKPNYLYTFHIFTLDFRGERLLEKNLLSQWQGVVASVTWWDDNTLEFVASLGPGSPNERYRYLIAEQKLSVVNSLESGFVPLQSKVQEKLSAVVSRQRNLVQLEIFDAFQQRMLATTLSSADLDISWAPDASGVLIFERDNKKLYRLDLAGRFSPMQILLDPNFTLDRPRYSRDGRTILLTVSAAKNQYHLRDLAGAERAITSARDIYLQPLFSPEGEAIIFVSLVDGKYQLRQSRDQREELLFTFSASPDTVVWPAARNFLLYRVGGAIWQYDFSAQAANLLLQDAEPADLLGYEPKDNALWLLKHNNHTANIWRRDLTTAAERQLTFGSVGAALEFDARIYFQYSGQRGLWLLDEAQQNPRQISTKLPSNAKLLRVLKEAAFFVAGGPCRETAVQRLDFGSDSVTVVSESAQAMIVSHDFHPAKGVLQSRCNTPVSNIIELGPARSSQQP